MIKTFSVYNFKVIEALEKVSFDRITLIGGKNNSGKTTLLEALFLSLDYKSRDVLNKLASWRDITGKFLPKDIWRLFFYNQDMTRNIKIILNGCDAEHSGQLSVKYLTDYKTAIQIPVTENGITIIKSNFPALELSHLSNSSIDYQVHVLSESEIYNYLKEIDSGIDLSKVFYMGERMSLYEKNVEYLGILDKADEQEKILPLLRLLEPNLVRLQLINDGIQNIIYADFGNKRKIPVSLLGEGFCRCLTMSLVIAANDANVFLLDEAGRGIHYSLQDSFWEFMNKLSLEHKCQIIATTHSYEFLESLCAVCKKDNVRDISYLRLDKTAETQISAVHYDVDVFVDALSTNWEMR